MTDDEIIAILRESAATRSPSKVAELLFEIHGESKHSILAMYFRRAFPSIPISVLVGEAGGWWRVSGGPLDDEAFDRLLSQWLPFQKHSP